MKHIKRFIKLASPNAQRLSKEKQKDLTGGLPSSQCGCACYYGDCSGSSCADNHDANYSEGLTSVEPHPGGDWGVA